MRAISGAILFLIIIMVAVPQAQSPAVVTPTSLGSAESTAATTGEIELLVRRSAILNLDAPITRVALTAPEVADALVTSPRQLIIHGKTPGAISLFVWDGAGCLRTYEVIVQRDLSDLSGRLRDLFPSEPIQVASSGRDVVLSGVVSSKYVVEKAAELATGYVEKKDDVVNLLRQREGTSSSQVLLRVRFAEVSRNALQELGASFFTDITGHRDYVGRSTTQQFPAPSFNEPGAIFPEGLIFSDYLNLLFFNAKENIGALIKALQTRGLFQSLAEPNLIALSGKEANLLAGGEFPYPVVQGVGAALAVTIQFKEFGIRLSFTPTDMGGDLIHLKVRPEVSALDFSNAVIVQGFKIPALTTRRTETEVELRDGQTFAIAGLLNNTATQQMSKIPGLGDIPILGLLFRSRAYQKAETELVVFITPQIVRGDSMGAANGLPSLVEPFLAQPHRTLPAPPPYTGSPKYPAPGQRSSASPDTSAPVPVVPQSVAPIAPETARASAPADSRPLAEPTVQSTPRKLTKAEQKALEKAHAALRKQQEEARRRAEQARRVAERDAARQRAAEARAARTRGATLAQNRSVISAEQVRREAAAARKRAAKEADAARRRAEEERKRAKALAEAEAPLRAAEAAAAKKRAEEDRNRAEAVADVEARLKAAQAAHQKARERLAEVNGGDASQISVPPPQ